MGSNFDFKLNINENNIPLAISELRNKKRRILETWGLFLVTQVKKLTPVDTGRLRNSITHEVEGENTVAVGSNVEYAKYVCLGTRKMKARDFLTPPFKNNKDKLKTMAENILKE